MIGSLINTENAVGLFNNLLAGPSASNVTHTILGVSMPNSTFMQLYMTVLGTSPNGNMAHRSDRRPAEATLTSALAGLGITTAEDLRAFMNPQHQQEFSVDGYDSNRGTAVALSSSVIIGLVALFLILKK